MPDPKPVLTAQSAEVALTALSVEEGQWQGNLLDNSVSSDQVLMSSDTDMVPATLEADSPDTDMPLFRRIGTGELIPYCWISALDDADTLISAGVSAFETEGDASVSKPIQYAGVISFKAVNEYGKHPYVEFEVSDPDYLSPKGKDGSLIDRLKVGAMIEANFGYKGAHVRWKNLKVISNDIAFHNGSAYLTIKAVHGGSFKAFSSSEVYTNNAGKLGIEVLASAVGYDSVKLNLLTQEYEDLKRENEGIPGAVGFSYSLSKKGLHYRFDPSSEDLIVETPFKEELVKRGQKPMKITYGYPISTIASIEYKKEYPKKGKSNNKGKLGLTDQGNKTSTGVDVTKKTITVYVRGTFLAFDGGDTRVYASIGPSPGERGAVDVPSIEDAYKQYPAKDGYIILENTSGRVSFSGNKLYDVKRVFNVGDLVQSDLKTSQKDALQFQQGTGQRYLVYDQGSFYYENGTIYVKYYEYSANAPKEAPPPKTEKGRTEKVVDGKGDELYEWVTTSQGAAFIQSGYEDADFSKNSGDPQAKEQELLKKLRERAKKSPDKYRLATKKDGAGTTYYLEEKMPITQKPEDGSSASKEGASGATVDDAVSGGDSAIPDAEPKSQEPSSKSANVRAVRALPKEELTIDLRAGDWSMKVGKIVEVIHAHKVINGYWYINKEEHSVSADGFQTTLTCRKARSSEVRSYGAPKVKASKGTSKPKGGDEATQKSEAQKADAPIKVTTEASVKAQQDLQKYSAAVSDGRANYAIKRGSIR